MAEKLSEQQIRLDKIAQLKTKVLNDIDEYVNRYKSTLREYISDEYFNQIIEQCFIMARLKEYFEGEHLFKGYEAICESEDTIVYIVSTHDIDIWLDDDFDFVINFIVKARMYDVYAMLNEKYFGYNFTTIIEQMVYDDKHNN